MKKFFSRFIALCLVFSIFSSHFITNAEDKAIKVIATIDTSKISGENVDDLLKNGDYEKLKDLNSNSLDSAKNLMNESIGDFEELSRDDFLLPFISFEATESQIEKLKGLDFIKNIEYDVEYDVNLKPNILKPTPRNAVHAAKIIGIDDDFWNKYDGSGECVGVIDANFDPKHEVFKPDNILSPSVKKDDIIKLIKHKNGENKNFTEDKIYLNEKIPLAYHYINENSELNPENKEEGHGQHVAAIIAGNKSKIKDRYDWRGIAPSSQLLMMNCFANEGTSASYYIRAISDAVYLRASAINMSLGGTKGTVRNQDSADKSVSKIIDMASSVGTNVVIAAGNEGEYEGDISIDNPDFGTIGSPGIQQNAITVASVENSEYIAKYLLIDNEKIAYGEVDNRNFENKTFEVVDCGDALDNSKLPNVNDKVALVKRGGDTFNNKIKRLEDKGAKGVIIYNNVVGNFKMSLDNSSTIPAISISMIDGERLKSKLPTKMTITGEEDLVKNPLEGRMSGFSNWGLTADGVLKPDLSAPGGHIYSAKNKSGFVEMSGTSMATPHVSGAVAILSQSLKQREEFKKLSVANRGKLIKTLLMNSANPLNDKENNVPISPRQQGAGIINIKSATELDFTVLDKKTNMASVFIDGIDDTIVLNLKIKNYSNKDKEITPSTLVTIDAHNGKKNLLKPTELFSRTYENEKFVISANSEIEKEIRIPLENLERLNDFEKGAFVEGFLTLSANDGKKASFPFVTFKGDFKNLPIIEKPVYNFDFEKENPMFWNLKPSANAWHRFMTHIESKVDDKHIVLGLKNFDELNDVKKLQKDTDIKPEFNKKLVISPNGDGKLDEISLYSVFTRTADARYEIKNSKGVIVAENKDMKLFLKNISYWADKEDLNEKFLGYTHLGLENLNKQLDGEYTLSIIGKPVVEGASEQKHDIKFSIDKIAPKFKDAKFDKETKKFTFSVEDENEIKDVQATGIEMVEIWQGNPEYKQEKEVPLDVKSIGENKYEIQLKDDTKLRDVSVTARDIAYNEYVEDAELMITTENLGRLEVVAKTTDGEIVPIKFEVSENIESGQGKIVKNTEKLRKGSYDFRYIFCPIQYKLIGKEEHTFEVNDSNLNPKIELLFEKQKIGQKMLLVRGTGDLTFADFKITATNTESNMKFQLKQEIEETPQFFFDAPYGNYKLDVEITNKDKALKYNYELSTETEKDITEITIDENSFKERVDLLFSENEFKVIPKTLGYNEHIDYMGMNLSVGKPVNIRSIGRGISDIVPKAVPEGYYVVPGMRTVKLTKENPVQEVNFEYFKENEEDKFTLLIQDNTKEKGVDVKYKIYNYNERFNFGYGEIELDYTPGMKLSPGWYCIEAQEEYGLKAQANEPTPMLNLKEKAIEVEKGTKNVTVGFTWGNINDGSFVEKYSKKIIVDMPEGYPNDELNLEIRDQNTNEKIIGHIYKKLDEKTHSVIVPTGAYNVVVTNLAKGYTCLENKIWVFGSTGKDIELNITRNIINGKDVNIKFKVGEIEVPNVKFKLNDLDYKSGNNLLEVGKYKLEIVSPESYRGKNIDKEIEIKEDTTEIISKLNEITNGTVDIKLEFIDTKDRASIIRLDDREISIGNKIPISIGNHKIEIVDIDGKILDYEISPKSLFEFNLSLENPDQVFNFKIRKKYSSIDVSELNVLIKESDEIKKSEKYLSSIDELKELYDDSIKNGNDLLVNEKNRTEFNVKKAIEDIKFAKESLDGNKPYAKLVRKLKDYIDEKESILKGQLYINSDEDKTDEYLASIENAKNLLSVNFELSELESALKDIENSKKEMGLLIKIRIVGNILDDLKIKAINEITGEKIELERVGECFEKSVLLGKYKIKVELGEIYKANKNNFEVELTANKMVEESITISKKHHDFEDDNPVDDQNKILIILGADQIIQKGGKIKDIKIDEDFEKFKNIYFDDNELDKKFYSVKKGSTIISFKEDFSKTLEVGEHKLTFEFVGGKVDTKLIIMNEKDFVENRRLKDKNNSNKNPKLIKTGISSENIFLFFAIAISLLSILSIRKKINY